MTGNEKEPASELLTVWRLVAIAVDTFLILFTTVADTLGRLYVDPNFRVSEILFGSLIGAWLGLLGIEGLSRFRSRNHGS